MLSKLFKKKVKEPAISLSPYVCSKCGRFLGVLKITDPKKGDVIMVHPCKCSYRRLV